MHKPIHLFTLIATFISISIASEISANEINKNKDSSFIEAYKPNYILISSDGGDNNDRIRNDDCDIKFQFSFRKRLYAPHPIWQITSESVKDFLGEFYFSYSQKSFWDICRDSAPFRENNYNPSLFFDNSFGDVLVGNNTITFDNSYGYEHESNGEDENRSRSWDRVFYEQRIGFGNKVKGSFKSNNSDEDKYRHEIRLRYWSIINKSGKNSQIEDYQGYIEASYYWTGINHHVQLTARRKNLRLDWFIKEVPYVGGREGEYYWLVQYFSGYGDSLERYNIKEDVFRIGVAFSY